ncbi:MAG: hypothetical protein RLZZ175_2319 [Bacteroidota bacterium]|jgi:uncharacterized protein YxeA
MKKIFSSIALVALLAVGSASAFSINHDGDKKCCKKGDKKECKDEKKDGKCCKKDKKGKSCCKKGEAKDSTSAK